MLADPSEALAGAALDPSKRRLDAHWAHSSVAARARVRATRARARRQENKQTKRCGSYANEKNCFQMADALTLTAIAFGDARHRAPSDYGGGPSIDGPWIDLSAQRVGGGEGEYERLFSSPLAINDTQRVVGAQARSIVARSMAEVCSVATGCSCTLAR